MASIDLRHPPKSSESITFFPPIDSGKEEKNTKTLKKLMFTKESLQGLSGKIIIKQREPDPTFQHTKYISIIVHNDLEFSPEQLKDIKNILEKFGNTKLDYNYDNKAAFNLCSDLESFESRLSEYHDQRSSDIHRLFSSADSKNKNTQKEEPKKNKCIIM